MPKKIGRWYNVDIWVNNICYIVKGHPEVGWAPIGFAVAAPWTDLPQSVVFGWAPIGFAGMATPRPSQYYFGHTVIPNFVRYSYNTQVRIDTDSKCISSVFQKMFQVMLSKWLCKLWTILGFFRMHNHPEVMWWVGHCMGANKSPHDRRLDVQCSEKMTSETPFLFEPKWLTTKMDLC